MWLKKKSRVRSVKAAQAASTISPGVRGRTGSAKGPQRQAPALGGPLPAPVHGSVFVVGQQDFARRRQATARSRRY